MGDWDQKFQMTSTLGRKSVGWAFCVDRGGTFTDVIGRAPDGREVALKIPSKGYGPDDAAVIAMRRMLNIADGAPFPADRTSSIRIGTTVATNAVLERSGAKTLFVTNQGFADALVIGDQTRPKLFALDIEKLPPLYAGVVESAGRMAADGAVVTPLCRDALRRELDTALAAGFESVAITFLHGDLYPDHERQAAAGARMAGFRFIATGSEVSPLPRFIARAQTAVADAYLTPGLRAYVDTLTRALNGADLYFMTSGGGLVRAEVFRGRDAVLSGPAGGVIAVAGLTGSTRHPSVLGFDMGGTSTDVCRFAGRIERRDHAEVAGVRLRSSMVDVETIAAGGGSILDFDGFRARVGPASAGADPGPAAYGRGGPATITDANLVLGRLDPDAMPKLFGRLGDAAMDAAAARSRLADLAIRMGFSSPETAAEGFLAIAVEQMAGAIRRVSTERGFDPRDHALIAFGGAAGQVACHIAEALDMDEILSPPYASLMSAWGIGQARLRVARRVGLAAALDETGATIAADAAARLAVEARAALESQGAGHPSMSARAAIRYAESDTALDVPLSSLNGMVRAFLAEHRRLFGFVEPDHAMVIESIEVEAVDEPAPGAQGAMADEIADARTLGGPVEGPALITMPDTQIWVAQGWRAIHEAGGSIRLLRVSPCVRRPLSHAVADPITLELFNRRFMGVAEAMGAALERTARSVNIKERLDFSCALFDEEGDLVANAPHMPVHLGSMGASVRAVQARHTRLTPGDAFALNNPYAGGTHLPDITVVMPVFQGERPEPMFFVAARGHHADVGGVQPGSMPPFSRTVDEEGVLLDALPIMRRGVFLERDIRAALDGGAHPARSIDRNIADLKAQLAACQTGANAVIAMIDSLGVDAVSRYMRFVQANAEANVRKAITRLADGVARVAMDGGAVIAVDITVEPDAGRATLDFTGTSAQLPNNFNAPTAIVSAAALYVFRTLVDDDIPLNAGCLKPLDLRVPAGSMLSPEPPAAVVAGNVETSQHIVDALYEALGVMAHSQGTMNNFTFGDEAGQYYETICGGAGATAAAPGASAVHSHMTNSRLTDPEILERRFPIRVEHFAVRKKSGGRGARAGGDGVIRRIRFLAAMDVALLSTRREYAPSGLRGGFDGEPGRHRLIGADGTVKELPGCFSLMVQPGDAIEIETPGGGGYGTPDALP
jgi:5-oxoprolinase (ATP-hydrolysing)